MPTTPIDQFIRDAVVLDPDGSVQASDLYAAYVEWYPTRERSIGEYRLSQAAFGRAVIAYGIPRRRKGSARHYMGIALRACRPTTGCPDTHREG